MIKYMLEQMTETIGGGTIVGLIKDDEDGKYGFQVKTKDALYDVWVLQDEEGNGPGFLDIMKA